MSVEISRRRPNRLPDYDYAQTGVYFLTVCTRNRECILSTISVGAVIGRPPSVELTEIGKHAEIALVDIPNHYKGVFLDHYVIMPNHIHLLLRFENENGRPMTAPTVQQIINQFKGIVTKRVGLAVWQKGFYDHIVRDEYDYRIRWQYIDENPMRWAQKEHEKQ